jgi:hypothetical protein
LSDPLVSDARRALHAVAELVLAGPQYRRSGTIRLQVRPGGFGTIKEPDLAVHGAALAVADRRIPLSGHSLRDLADAAGVEAGAPADLYRDGSGAAPDDVFTVDPGAAELIADWYAIGEAALRRLDPGQTPVLWPEHFDLAITVDEVNYGVSPGDGYLDEPYAYVGPWQARTGEFWTVPFGAARPRTELSDVDTVAAFFHEGRHRAEIDPVAGGERSS